MLGGKPGEVGGHCECTVARRLVEAHGQAPPNRTYEIDLHVDRHRPGEPLIDPKKDVGQDHPAQFGANMSSNGTGNAANQPATRTGLRPKRSDSGPAATLVRAL